MSNIKIEPKPAYGLDKARQDPLNCANLVIESRNNRTVLSLNKRLYTMFYDELNLPRVSFASDKIMNLPQMSELPRRAPKNAIADGTSPMVQLVIQCVNRGEKYSFDDIYRYVASEKKFVKDSKPNYHRLRNIVDKMWNKMYLKTETTPDDSKFKLGPKSPEIGKNGIFRRLEEGKHPTKNEIRRFVKERGSAQLGDIENYMLNSLNWFDIYGSEVDALNNMLDSMVDDEYLEKFGSTFTVGKVIPPRGDLNG